MTRPTDPARPNRRAAAQAARKLAAELPISHPTQLALEIVAHARRARVKTVPLARAEASVVRVGERGVIGVAAEQAYHRRRFSIAHELGHFELHPESCWLDACVSSDGLEPRNTPKPAREHEADAFATEYLMPRRLLAPRCADADATWDFVHDVAGEFDVSLTSAAMRFVSLSKRPVALVCLREGRVAWQRTAWRMRARIEGGRTPGARSSAIAARPWWPTERTTVPADTWLSGAAPGEVVREHALAMEAYGRVMVLIEGVG